MKFGSKVGILSDMDMDLIEYNEKTGEIYTKTIRFRPRGYWID